MSPIIIDVEYQYQALFRYLYNPYHSNTADKVNKIIHTLIATPDGLAKAMHLYRDEDLTSSQLWGITNILLDLISEIDRLLTPNKCWYSIIDHQILISSDQYIDPITWLEAIKESGYLVSGEVVKYFNDYVRDTT